MASEFLSYRAFVIAYAALLPIYFYHRFVHSIVSPWSFIGCYQWLTCILELYGALNVLLLGFVRFRRPWAPAVPVPPTLPDDGDEEHQRLAPCRDDDPARGPFDVAILVPCYSEPDDVIFGTIEAALALHDPLAARVRVVLCDDGGREARREQLARLAPPERALYVSRPKLPNVPRHGKAGNLNHTLREVLYPGGGPPPAEFAGQTRIFW